MAVSNSIAGALPELVVAESDLRMRAQALGIGYRIADFGGAPRTLADTIKIMSYRAADYAKAVASGEISASTPINVFRPINAYGTSYHNYGAAFDVLITSAPPGMSFDLALARLKALAPAVGLRSNVPNDPPHFELPISLEEAKARWEVNSPDTNDEVTTTTVSVVGVAVVIGIVIVLAARQSR